MVRAIPRGLGRAVWPLMVVTLVALAVYVSGGRLLLNALPGVQQDIEQLLSQRLSGDIRIGEISGSMDGFTPRLDLIDFSILDGETGVSIQLPAASLRLNPWQSLLSGAPRFEELTLIAPRVQWNGPVGTESSAIPAGVRDFLSSFTRLQIRDAHITSEFDRDGSPVALELLRVDLDLVRDRSRRVIRISVDSKEGRLLSAEGSGTGNPFEFGQFSGEAYGNVTGLGVSYLSQLLKRQITVLGQADFWFSVEQGIPNALVSAAFEDLESSGDAMISLDELRFDAAIRGPFDQTQIWIERASASAAEQTFFAPRMHIDRLGQGWKILTDSFEAQPLSAVLAGSGALPDGATTVLRTLNPRGRIERLALTIESLTDPLALWAAQAEVTDATTDPFKKVPGLVGIDASLSATESGAIAWIATRDFELDLPKVYEESIQLARVTGKLEGRWQRDALFLEQGMFVVAAAEHDATVQFEIDIPFSKKASVPLDMRLSAAVTDAPVSIRNAYIPYRMPLPAYQWLQGALIEGRIEESVFLWRGGFKPYGDPGQTMQLAADLSGMSLDYQRGWPTASQVESQLRLNDRRIDIWSSQGDVAGLTMKATAVALDIDAGAAWFTMQSQVSSAPGELLQALQRLPALSIAAPVMSDLSVQGEEAADTRLNMSFNLKDVLDTLDVSVEVDLAEARLGSTLLDVQAEHVTGRLNYRTQRGFDSPGLTASVFGRQLTVEMGPHLATAPNTLLAARLDFEASVSDLLSWQGVSDSIPAQGITPVTVDVNVADGVTVDIKTDLQGVAVDLPLPWGKPAETRAPLEVTWRDREWAAWEVFWFGRFSAIADLPRRGAAAASIDVTPRTRSINWPLIAPDPGLRITGYLPSLDPADWQDSVSGLPVNNVNPLSAVRVEALRIGRVLWRGEELGSLDLNLDIERDAIDVRIEMPWLRADYQQRRSDPVSESASGLEAALERQLTIDYLDLQGLPQVGEQLAKRSPPDPEGNVGSWMRALPVSVKAVHRGDTGLGGLALVIDYEDTEGWQFRDVAGNFLGIQWLPSTRIAWRSAAEDESTTLLLAAELNDIAESLKLVGVAPLVETRSGKLQAEWQWPGSPADFELTSVTGRMDLEMQSGSFVTANAEATGALRLLSLLNLSGLFRRANMNQLFDAGVTFDRAQGRFDFASGDLRIPAFSIEGSGGYFTFSSDIDLITETLSGELVVTLPLVENIPWVAALAGGLPVAAATYLASKVFEAQVNQLSSGVYAVSGDLDNPQVVFERVFDANSRLPTVEDQVSAEAVPSSSDR